jgi:hypothetical protein
MSLPEAHLPWPAGRARGIRPFRNFDLCRHEKESPRSLKRIIPQVEYIRGTQRHNRLPPDVEPMGALLHEMDLPVPHSQRQQVAVVAPVEESLARILFDLSFREWEQVVPVDVDLERRIAALVPFFSFSTASGSPAIARNVGSQS